MEPIIHNIREFNRYYTNKLDVFNTNTFNTSYTFTEARIIIEIGIRGQCIANDLTRILHIDKGYLSRLLNKFKKDGLIKKIKSSDDKRVYFIQLTDNGRALFNHLNAASNQQVETMLSNLSQEDILTLNACMNTIQNIFEKRQIND